MPQQSTVTATILAQYKHTKCMVPKHCSGFLYIRNKTIQIWQHWSLSCADARRDYTLLRLIRRNKETSVWYWDSPYRPRLLYIRVQAEEIRAHNQQKETDYKWVWWYFRGGISRNTSIFLTSEVCRFLPSHFSTYYIFFWKRFIWRETTFPIYFCWMWI